MSNGNTKFADVDLILEDKSLSALRLKLAAIQHKQELDKNYSILSYMKPSDYDLLVVNAHKSDLDFKKFEEAYKEKKRMEEANEVLSRKQHEELDKIKRIALMKAFPGRDFDWESPLSSPKVTQEEKRKYGISR